MSEGGTHRTRTVAGFRVHGRVQGVGYRWWTHREAERLGLAGTVRNLADGTVEVMAAGSDDALDRLERSLRRGPPLAQVDRVEAVVCSLPAELDDFRVVR